MEDAEIKKRALHLPWRELIAFIVTAVCMVGLLVTVAMIPRETIRPNMEESAEFFCNRALFGHVIRGIKSSCIDRYSDAILLNIAWHYDEDHPLKSTMWSGYYDDPDLNSNRDLAYSVSENEPSNTQYIRYWHGSNTIVRSLLTIMPVSGIYTWNAVWLIIFTAILIYLLIRKKAFVPFFALVAGLILTSSWFVPLSLEYTWTYPVMLVVSCLAWKLGHKKKRKCYTVLFLCSGMVINFLDFLTTETLTLTVPLLLLVWADREDSIKSAVKASGSWLCGYAGAWILKWGLASIVLRENAMPYITGHIHEWLIKREGLSSNPFLVSFTALARNLKCLFPFEYGWIGLIIGICLVLLYVYLAYVYRGKNYDRKRVVLYLLIGIIPYIRYIVLHNHAHVHCFFTYRAQLGTVVALVLILEELGSLDAIKRRFHHAK